MSLVHFVLFGSCESLIRLQVFVSDMSNLQRVTSVLFWCCETHDCVVVGGLWEVVDNLWKISKKSMRWQNFGGANYFRVALADSSA